MYGKGKNRSIKWRSAADFAEFFARLRVSGIVFLRASSNRWTRKALWAGTIISSIRGGQYMARDIGATVYNFSRGGMTAKEYCDSFAKQSGFWNVRLAAQAYIIALGVNDMCHLEKYECGFGAMADVDFENEENNKKTFAGYYCKIIQKVRKIQPQSKIFVMTMPREAGLTEGAAYENYEKHAEFLRELPKYFRNLYVLDFRKYAPVYDKEFDDKYRMSGHLNAAGYLLTARMVESYIDYIIRANYKDFAQVGFIGTGFYNKNEKPL